MDDPSSHPELFPTEEAQNAERERLFDLLRQMMQKKMHEHPEVYAKARAEMLKHCDGKLPPLLDPFSGGGSIPLEAARLGFEAHAADLNPVAVLLNKCNLELVPRWLDQPSVNPEARKGLFSKVGRSGTRGLAEDVRYYGRIVHERAIKKIGHLYPKVRLPKEYGGREANVIAWIWARTVASPNPAVKGVHVPLISSFWLSSKKGILTWLKPIVNKKDNSWLFEVHTGEPPDKTTVKNGTKAGRAVFSCILTGDKIKNKHINGQASRGMLSFRLLAIIAEGNRNKLYLPADTSQEQLASVVAPQDVLSEPGGGTFAGNAVGLPYGFKHFRDYYTSRQLTAMVTLSDLVKEVSKDVLGDAQEAGVLGSDAAEYSKTIATFLALAVDRCADFNNSLCQWSSSNQKVMHLFGKQAIPMVFNFAEANILGSAVGAWATCSDYVAECIEVIGQSAGKNGKGWQVDATSSWNDTRGLLVSTDPPYYDNIGYAALSDFFYVWLRRIIGNFFPDLFKTILVPKDPELTAASERFGGDKEKAKEHFESGFRKAFTALRKKMDLCFPLTVYYAFKQEDEEAGENKGEERIPNGVDRTTGWETLLDALLGSGFQITATWPIRSEQRWRTNAMGTNALASCIVLACRPRPSDASQRSRREFMGELKKELPAALKHLQQGNIAPVDLAQASIGPGMAVFSRYSRVMESSGNSMTVRTALALINQTLDEVLAEQEGEFDADTRWALAWFEQHSMEEGPFGVAETLSEGAGT